MNPDRFIIIQQSKPTHWETMLLHDNKLVSLPLCFEVVDRGPNFVTWDSSTVEEVTLARFATSREASRLLAILKG